MKTMDALNLCARELVLRAGRLAKAVIDDPALRDAKSTPLDLLADWYGDFLEYHRVLTRRCICVHAPELHGTDGCSMDTCECGHPGSFEGSGSAGDPLAGPLRDKCGDCAAPDVEVAGYWGGVGYVCGPCNTKRINECPPPELDRLRACLATIRDRSIRKLPGIPEPTCTLCGGKNGDHGEDFSCGIAAAQLRATGL